jgi:fatty-acyl-CoA synthase
MFRTGDLGRLSGDGFVFEARIGDAMRLGGFLVSPEEIEAVIQAQPGVAGVQVVAAANGDSDPVPVAFVRPVDGTALDEVALRARCREQLARFKVPARVVAVEAFPTVDGPNGRKVQRMRLREMAEELLREDERGRPHEFRAGLRQR